MTFAINEQYVMDQKGDPVSVILNIDIYRNHPCL